ncbi:MAG TPA: hypothetical protein VK810_01475, partial [Dongiaceae bacterium]|nr:hypothetical protein [Dongiaceae bacterium]
MLFVIANVVHAGRPDADALSAIEATDPISNDLLPMGTTYYSAANPNGPPMPGNMGYDAWQIDSNTFLLDDLDSGFAGRFHAMDDLSPPDFGDVGDGGGIDLFTNNYHFDTNGLWLEITNVSNGLASVNLHNATDYVYEVWSKTDLLASNWDIETEIFPTDTNSMPFTVPTSERTNLFIWARNWTGVTSLGNTAPEWWFYLYFGTVDLSDTNLDANGNTLLYDYTNNFAPGTFSFYSIQVANNYVNSGSAAAQLNVKGSPYYV